MKNNCKHEKINYDDEIDGYWCEECEKYISKEKVEKASKPERG